MTQADLIITVDHELPAGGEGDVRRLMIQPLERLLNACEWHRAPLTIMAEMGEIWAFENPENESYTTRLGYRPAAEIRRQLIEAARRGHDVQLHLHPQWLGARWRQGRWLLDYDHYQATSLGRDALAAVLRRGRDDLEAMLRVHDPDYTCLGFRAGHWNTQPSPVYLAALHDAGLRSDTSVFKWGHISRQSVRFDYRSAHHNVAAWRACPQDINRNDPTGDILEAPIATLQVGLLRMLTLKRLLMALRYTREDRLIERGVADAAPQGSGPQGSGERSASGGVLGKLRGLFRPRALKLDFCKMSAREMEAMVDHLLEQCDRENITGPVPIVMIGHTKQVDSAIDLSRLLGRLRHRYADSLNFSTYRQFILKTLGAVEGVRSEPIGLAPGVAPTEISPGETDFA